MKVIFKMLFTAVCSAAIISGCTKNNNDINGAENTAAAASSSLTLNNRIVAGFITDASTLPALPAGILPAEGTYNRFRKLFTYDTISVVNKPPAYTAGNVVTIVGYLRGDDFALTKRKINLSFFKAPPSFITPANPPTVINVLQRAEDSYRSYQPSAQTGVTLPTATPPNAPIFSPVADTTFTLPIISAAITGSLTVTNAVSESIGGINYTTYLVSLSFTIPAAYGTKFTPGSVYSLNLNTGATFGFLNSAENLGNTNWIYAFRIR